MNLKILHVVQAKNESSTKFVKVLMGKAITAPSGVGGKVAEEMKFSVREGTVYIDFYCNHRM